MSGFLVGDIVDIAIKGARVIGKGYDGRYQTPYVDVALSVGGEEPRGRIHLHGRGVTVERVAPAEWPPRVGDLWRDRSKNVWLAVGADSENKLLMVRSIDGWRFPPETAAEEFGPMALVHREEQDAPAQPADLDDVALLRTAVTKLRALNSKVWAELQSAPDRDPRYAPPFNPDSEYVFALLRDLGEETARTPVLQLATLMTPTLLHLLTNLLESSSDEAKATEQHPLDIARVIVDELDGGEE